MNCQHCGKEEALPFVCNYCGGVFCGDHRLPEAHGCTGDLRTKPFVTSQQSYATRSFDAASPSAVKPGVFSRLEVRDIVIAWVVLSIAFTIARTGGVYGFLQVTQFGSGVAATLGISLLVVGSGFVLHELMHKFTAQKYRYWAEFRLWPFGVFFALLTSFGGFLFAAPGATYIKGYSVPDRQNGIISLAGPAINVVVAILFIPLLFVENIMLQSAGRIGLSVNFFLAAFNMVPVMPLDGAKVFRWNKLLWAGIFIPLAAIVAIVFFRI